ncbi:MAG TPA: 3-deoxy-D-manno-octulosonic acid kinase [Gammaproteobacteria bacterium]
MVEEAIVRTRGGVILTAASRRAAARDGWFEAEYWRRQGAQVEETPGRGQVLVVEHDGETWAVRHYHRGGLVSKLVEDHYLWLGLARTRSFREWRLLAALEEAALPAPAPIAARVQRIGPIYTADLITRYLPDTRRLSSHLADGTTPREAWERIGGMVRAFHDHGVDHPDLTAHNILLDSQGLPFLVDFDNAVLRPPGAWRGAGVARLERSLRKVAMETGTEFDDEAWRLLRRGYDEAVACRPRPVSPAARAAK